MPLACLELGASPYFTTMLLRRYSPLRLTLANYFGPQITTPTLDQRVCVDGATDTLPTYHFNIESERFPFDDSALDLLWAWGKRVGYYFVEAAHAFRVQILPVPRRHLQPVQQDAVR